MKMVKFAFVVLAAATMTACGGAAEETTETPATTPATETPATETPATETPATETPADTTAACDAACEGTEAAH